MKHSFMNGIVILLGKDCVQTGLVDDDVIVGSRRKMTQYLHSTFVGICHDHKRITRVTRVFSHDDWLSTVIDLSGCAVEDFYVLTKA